ncbi:MAG TPA: hypothetical protein DCW47_00640 [Lachnospiraceae bacterium]|nr:hypothetical protein [Lachnospiraceae bacterium]
MFDKSKTYFVKKSVDISNTICIMSFCEQGRSGFFPERLFLYHRAAGCMITSALPRAESGYYHIRQPEKLPQGYYSQPKRL